MQNSEGNPCNLQITLLNNRSFNKHVIDVGRDTRLTESDTICFTETQLHSSAAPKRRLEKFEMTYNNSEDKFQSLAIAFRNDDSVVTDTKLNGASIIEFVKPGFDSSLKLLLLYKKNAVTLTSFCKWLGAIAQSMLFCVILISMLWVKTKDS